MELGLLTEPTCSVTLNQHHIPWGPWNRCCCCCCLETDPKGWDTAGSDPGQLQFLSDKHTETHMHSRSTDNTTMTDLLSCIITSVTLKSINLWFMSFQCSCTKHSSTLTLPIPNYNNCSCPFQVSKGKKVNETEEKGRFFSHCKGLSAAQAEWSICCKHLFKAGRKWHFWHILPRWKS